MAGTKRPRNSPPESAKLTDAERAEFRKALNYQIGIGKAVPPVAGPITPERAVVLNTTGLVPNLVDADAMVLKVRNTLGLPIKKWTDAKMRAIRELGQFEYMKISAGILAVTGFDSVQQIEAAIGHGQKMMADESLEPEHRVAAGNMIAKCSEALIDLSQQLMSLVEQSSAKPKGPAERPKNLPPIIPPHVAVQVNVGGTTPPATPAAAALVTVTNGSITDVK